MNEVGIGSYLSRRVYIVFIHVLVLLPVGTGIDTCFMYEMNVCMGKVSYPSRRAIMLTGQYVWVRIPVATGIDTCFMYMFLHV